MPAGTPLAVGDKVVVQTPLGLLAIDFESGRRVWLTSAVPMAEVDEAGAGGSLGRVFDDATSGNLASDGKLVFAVESPADALAVSRATIDGFGDPLNNGRDWEGGNTLTAYDLATGGARWRLPRPNQQRAGEDAAEPKRAAGGQLRSRWHLGPPLVAGDDLFLLVEEDGEVLVEARSAASGELRWWQPLASHDADGAITSGNQTDRRRAGLTSALDDGVLVCPIGSGCVLAIDVATRSLLWAHAYPRPETARELGRFGARELDGRKDEPARFGEPAPIIAGGRVILAPFDAETVRCLNLRDGTPVWQRPRGDMLAVAGVVDGRAVLVGGSRVEAIDVATGKRIWKRDLDEGVHPSGRGVLTRTALLLPCDTPGVVEVSVADGRIIGRSPARGGQIPGSLIAHRGEVISRGLIRHRPRDADRDGAQGGSGEPLGVELAGPVGDRTGRPRGGLRRPGKGRGRHRLHASSRGRRRRGRAGHATRLSRGRPRDADRDGAQGGSGEPLGVRPATEPRPGRTCCTCSRTPQPASRAVHFVTRPIPG